MRYSGRRRLIFCVAVASALAACGMGRPASVTPTRPPDVLSGAEIEPDGPGDATNTSAEFPDEIIVGNAPPPREGTGATRAPRRSTLADLGDPCELDVTLAPAACASLRGQMSGARERILDLFAQSPMHRGRKAWVRAVLRRPEREAEAPAGSTNVRASTAVAATTRMRARLTGDGFHVSPAGWQELPPSVSREGEWNWEVTPTREGRRALVVTVVPQLVLPDGRTIDVQPFTKTLEVEVRVLAGEASQEAAKGLDTQARSWATTLGGLAVLLGALGALLVAYRKLRDTWRGKAPERPKPGA